MKRISRSFFLMILLAAATFTVTAYAAYMDFSDVRANDWFYDDIYKLTESGAISGFDDGTFRPQKNITRSEFVKILMLALDYDLIGGSSFHDSKSHWAKDYISTALTKGIILKSEYEYGFEPDRPISRIEMTRMMMRALSLDPSADKSPFADINDQYATAAFKNHLILGSEKGQVVYFNPNVNATRAEASAVISRAVDFKEDPAEYQFTMIREQQSQKEDRPLNLKNIDSGSEPNEEQILSLLKTYDPDGYFIMDQSLKDGNDFMTWFTGYDFLDRIGIAVHEEGHRYSHSFPYSTLNGYDAALRNLFYIGNGKTITVKHTDIFNSKEMASGIPEDLRTFRFDTYVGAPRKNLASNVNGVYGLLDEFAAYYYGTKTSVDLYNYYMTLEQTPENWFNYIENVEGQYFAYAEFKYYILKYMLYAKNNHKDIYDGIISNTEFKQAYNIIDQKYVNLINKYFNNKQELIGHLKSLGYNAYENENYFFIGNVGRSVFINDYNKLMEEINKGIYDEIVRDLAL